MAAVRSDDNSETNLSKDSATVSDFNLEENEYFVEKIIDKRIKKKKVEYFLKWKGYSAKDNSWEPKENLYCLDLIDEFEENLKQKKKEKNSTSVSSRKRTLRETSPVSGPSKDHTELSPTPKKTKSS